MCIAFPGLVLAIDADGASAVVETEGRRRRASTFLVPDLAVGDWVTVAAGTVVDRLTPEEAAEVQALVVMVKGLDRPDADPSVGRHHIHRTKEPLMSTPPPRWIPGARAVPDRIDRGIALAVGAALISGLAIYLNASAVKALPDAAVFTTMKNAVAAAVLLGLVVASGAAGDVRRIERRQWPAGPRRRRDRRQHPVHPLLHRARPGERARARRSSRRPCSSGSRCWPCRSSASGSGWRRWPAWRS